MSFGSAHQAFSDASNTRGSPELHDAQPTTASGARKRKRDSKSVEDLLKDSFSVTPYPPKGSIRSRSLQPLLLLPRSRIPLSYLDINASTNALPQSRLFETHVKILELEERMGSEPMILIARLDDGRTLYAVEREGRGLYVLCQLGSWVSLQQLRGEAVLSKQNLFSKPTEKATGFDLVSGPLITPDAHEHNKKKQSAIEAIQSMLKRPTTSSGLSVSQPRETQPQPTPDLHVPVDLIDTTAPSASEMFENLRSQYLDALYLSKASLAYFAKGPLSRARAEFHLDYDLTLDINEYIAFLESLVLSTTVIDKKYREGVPGCVSSLDLNDHSADEQAAKPKKRRVSKKVKPGKSGLYPQEDILIGKWWRTHEDEFDIGASGSSREDITKSRISQLRIRETQLQMIIILEVLALQPLATATEDTGDKLPSALPAVPAEEPKDKASKAKKPDHLTKMIDVHIDRLCIWQSIALEAGQTSVDGGLATKRSELSNSLPKQTDTLLRDFCVEIIIPFYSSRLPDRCKIINHKLGGPIVVSAPKPRQLSKSASFSGTQSRPGAATKRPIPIKPRKSLQRVLTDERARELEHEHERRSGSRSHSRVPSLMRYATDPVPNLKREPSEAPSLSRVPTLENKTSRGGILNNKRFSQREVDLTAIAPINTSKAKKQADIQAELKEAISALKKPNRELAGKDVAESAEKRSASTSHRKSRKPVRNPLFQNIQIAATPRVNRQKDVFATQHQSLPKMEDEIGAYSLPSSTPLIPQSITRPASNRLGIDPSIALIQATPSRQHNVVTFQSSNAMLGLSQNDSGTFLPSSPLQQRKTTTRPFVPDSIVKRPNITSPSRSVQDTPIKKKSQINGMPGRPESLMNSNDKENNETGDLTLKGAPRDSRIDSIYTSLGWDDDSDELG